VSLAYGTGQLLIPALDSVFMMIAIGLSAALF
jgi:hypothetical protein